MLLDRFISLPINLIVLVCKSANTQIYIQTLTCIKAE